MNDITEPFFSSLEFYSLFPYLDESIKYINSLNISVEELFTSSAFEHIRFNGENKIYSLIEKNKIRKESFVTDGEFLRELLTYPYIKIILLCTNNKKIIRKYALLESIESIKYIKSSSYFSKKILIQFGINIGINVRINLKVHDLVDIFYYDYIKYSINIKSHKWKIINRNMNKGYITITSDEYLRFLQEVIYKKIDQSFNVEIPNIINKLCKTTVENIISFYNKYNDNSKIENIISQSKINKNLFPICIKKIFSDIQGGLNLSHSMRFSLVTFLNKIGMDSNEIIDLFGTSPDFDINQAMYQINHIISKKYKCPSCNTIRIYGNCLYSCNYMNLNSNPVSIYFYQLKKLGD